jgi:hypothetical protein
MGIFTRRIGPWTGELMYLARDASKNHELPIEDREYMKGVELYAAFSVRRGPNPFETPNLSSVALMGASDANYLINQVIEIGSAPDRRFGDHLKKAHDERMLLEELDG